VRTKHAKWGRLGATIRWSKYPPISIRFWNNIRIGKKQDCWPWLGSKSKNGYGKTKVKGVTISTHRLSAKLSGIKIDGISILHQCDNRICCNPNHLFGGSQKQNVRDAVSKGRMPMKLSDAQINQIRKRHKHGEDQEKLAKEFGVNQGHISKIVNFLRRN
jgi:hypothetical protein